MRRELLMFAFLAVTSVPLAATASTHYGEVVVLSRPGYASTLLWDINDSGTIVGNSDGVAFVYANGSFMTVAHPAGTFGTSLSGVANDGSLFGSYFWSTDQGESRSTGFVLSGGVYTDILVPGSLDTAIRQVSGNGRYLTGSWFDGQVTHGFAYDRETDARVDFTPPTTGGFYIVQGANDSGQITGNYSLFNGSAQVSESFVYDMSTGALQRFSSLPGSQRPRFRDINDLGIVAGFDAAVGAMVTDLVSTSFIQAPIGLTSPIAYGINDAGVVVGYAFDPVTENYSGWIATPVPEPSTWALWGLGLAALTTGARRARGRTTA